jgi:hypothetical protein
MKRSRVEEHGRLSKAEGKEKMRKIEKEEGEMNGKGREGLHERLAWFNGLGVLGCLT